MTAADGRELTDAVSRLRRALRRSIRSDYPWETRPVAQLEVLQTLADSGPARIGDLAQRLRLVPSTVSALVGKLAAAGLVIREADPNDRRAASVSLAAAGRRELRQWDRAHRRRLEKALGSLPERDRAAVLQAVPALGRLAEAIDRSG